jgi:hypothetical protein
MLQRSDAGSGNVVEPRHRLSFVGESERGALSQWRRAPLRPRVCPDRHWEMATNAALIFNPRQLSSRRVIHLRRRFGQW